MGHYYHYDGDGNLKNTITSGKWNCGHIVAIDTLGREIYFYGYGNEDVNPFYYRVYKANIDKEGLRLSVKKTGSIMLIFCSRDVIMLILIHE
ncbi:hypothetical protein BFINE_10510 [Bacteroides finegoldii DSM 17565]|nr:hypothetical protein BFINE_10510 [Bacteroides finegoldii DSM 17565]